MDQLATHDEGLTTLHKLPLGLTRYAGNKFDDLHNAGCKCITASSVPDLFGCGRNGRMALAAHVMGLIPFKDSDNDLTRRGHMLQDVVSGWYQDKTGEETKPVHAWVKHPTLKFYASPDSVIMPRTVEPRPGEVKIVAKQVYDEKWDGGPPDKVLLQHQSQLMLTGARSGPIIAACVGDFDFSLHHVEVEAHEGTQEAIMELVTEFLGYVDAGVMPPPDLADEKDQESVVKMAKIIEGEVTNLSDELLYYVKRYQRSGVIAKECKRRRDEAKAYLVAALNGNEIGFFEDGSSVKLTRIDYAEQHRKAYSVNRMDIKKPRKKK